MGKSELEQHLKWTDMDWYWKSLELVCTIVLYLHKMFVCMFDIYVVIKENHLDLHWTLSHMFIHSKNLVYLWEGVCNKAIPSQ